MHFRLNNAKFKKYKKEHLDLITKMILRNRKI